MREVISQIIAMPEPFNFVLLIVLIAMGFSTITAIAREIRKYASYRESIECVRDLAERGMSADQIERILRAQGATSASDLVARSIQACRGQSTT